MNDDQIRSLLRDARVTSSMPPEVASRLDDVLAELGSSVVPTKDPVVVPLRRRLAPRLLAAAAAVVLVAGVGVGLQQVLGQGGEDASMRSDSGAATADMAMPESVPEPAPTEASKPLDSDSGDARSEVAKDDRELLRAARELSSIDAYSRLLEKTPALQGVTRLNGVVQGEAHRDYWSGSLALDTSCATPFLSALPGSVNSVVLTTVGRALLVVGPDQGRGVHLVELWTCSTHRLVARETLDLR